MTARFVFVVLHGDAFLARASMCTGLCARLSLELVNAMNVWRDIYVANANQANVCISSNNAERLYKCMPIDFLPLKCYASQSKLNASSKEYTHTLYCIFRNTKRNFQPK